MPAFLKVAGDLLKKFVKNYVRQRAMDTAQDKGIIKTAIIVVCSIVIAIPLMCFIAFGELLWPQEKNDTSTVKITDGIWALSSKYEGGGDPGICSTGYNDPGG